MTQPLRTLTSKSESSESIGSSGDDKKKFKKNAIYR